MGEGGRNVSVHTTFSLFSITKLISFNFTMHRWHTPLLHSTHDRTGDRTLQARLSYPDSTPALSHSRSGKGMPIDRLPPVHTAQDETLTMY